MDSQGWKIIQQSLSPLSLKHTPGHLGISSSPQYLQAITYLCLHTSSDRKLIIPKAGPAVVG